MWKITKDYFAQPEDKPGTNGNAVGIESNDWDESRADRATIQFRMFDDDMNLVYEGVMDRYSHAPLDDFGTPNFGCTELRYLTPGKTVWELL